MTCHDMEELLIGFTGDELAPAQREFVELHLEGCGACRELVADLAFTRRQLERLRADGYRPQLTERVTDAITARQFRTAASLWLGRGARFAGGIAATMLIGFALVALMHGRLPLVREHTPAGPAAVEPAYLLADGVLIRVDAESGQARQVTPIAAPAVMARGGARRFILSGGYLTELSNPQTGQQRNVAPAEGARHLWASPDGNTVWLIRQESSEAFVIDKVDADTGQVTPDPSPKSGNILAGTISEDGRQLYLIGEWLGNNYLKVIDLPTGNLLKAHMLSDTGTMPTPLASVRSGQVYAVGTGWLLAVDPQGTEPGRLLKVPGLTPQAVLTADGQSLIAGHAGGGLLVIDPGTGKELRRVAGSAQYRRLFWSEDGRVLYAETDHALEVRRQGRLTLIGSPISLSGLPSALH